MSRHRWFGAVLGWIGVVAFVCAGCRGQGGVMDDGPLPTPIPGDAQRHESGGASAGSGRATPAAIAPEGLYDQIASLQASLAQRESDTFAGLWVQNEPEVRVFVAFTRDGQETVRPYVEGTPLAGTIVAQPADYTLVELLAAEAEVGRIVRELGFPFTWMVDVEGNRVKLLVTARAAFEAALKDANVELPDCVAVIETYVPPGQAPAGITPVPGVAFPQLQAGSTVHLDLDPLRGELVLEDGCLRVRTSDGASRLVIWQPGYYLSSDQGAIEIVDREGRVVWRVGEQIALGLASVPDWERQLREPLPAHCPGPYWVMDEIAE
ncbi:MAG: hypothetical protein JXA09_08315 [Anaerolineae bacterium]|nr:hypothetical protein [Anaerolineae bacterium]